MTALRRRLRATLDSLRTAGTYKSLRCLRSPMGPTVDIAGVGEVLLFCSNNYLGLANHPEVVEAAMRGLESYGAGTASVRFICGTFECHERLERLIADFLGVQAALTFVSCWTANEGLLPTLAGESDVILSDELNHASIIDACRLARQATRKVYAHASVDALEKLLVEHPSSAARIVVTDGVFSMEGDVAPLPQVCELCERHQATLVVDDSHGVGVLGATGRGVFEHFGISPCGSANSDVVLTGTLGKALGGAAGGFVAGPAEIVGMLVQRSRPQLFSNAIAPTVACSAAKAIEVLQREPERIARLQDNVRHMREGLRSLGYRVIESPTAIMPIILGDTAAAIRASNRLLELGVYVVGFGFPVVPEGAARLRVQMSAAHTPDHIDQSLDAFRKLKDELPESAFHPTH